MTSGSCLTFVDFTSNFIFNFFLIFNSSFKPTLSSSWRSGGRDSSSISTWTLSWTQIRSQARSNSSQNHWPHPSSATLSNDQPNLLRLLLFLLPTILRRVSHSTRNGPKLRKARRSLQSRIDQNQGLAARDRYLYQTSPEDQLQRRSKRKRE